MLAFPPRLDSYARLAGAARAISPYANPVDRAYIRITDLNLHISIAVRPLAVSGFLRNRDEETSDPLGNKALFFPVVLRNSSRQSPLNSGVWAEYSSLAFLFCLCFTAFSILRERCKSPDFRPIFW